MLPWVTVKLKTTQSLILLVYVNITTIPLLP